MDALTKAGIMQLGNDAYRAVCTVNASELSAWRMPSDKIKNLGRYYVFDGEVSLRLWFWISSATNLCLGLLIISNIHASHSSKIAGNIRNYDNMTWTATNLWESTKMPMKVTCTTIEWDHYRAPKRCRAQLRAWSIRGIRSLPQPLNQNRCLYVLTVWGAEKRQNWEHPEIVSI